MSPAFSSSVFSAFLGVITAFDLPTRQTFLVDMLDDDEQLASAIGINSSINTLTRLIGPFVAGLLVTWAGEGICFLVNAVS
jgi:MFS family permease